MSEGLVQTLTWTAIASPFVLGAVVFVRIPWLAGAILGTFLGVVAVSAIWLPFGGNAEQLGANLAAGLIGGAAAGAAVGWLVALGRRPVPDAAALTLGAAVAGTLVGSLLGGFGPALLTRTAPDLSVSVLLTTAVCMALGWAVGAAVGWRRSRSSPAPSSFQRGSCVVAGLVVGVVGTLLAAQIVRARGFGPPIEHVGRAGRALLPWVGAGAMVGTMLAVGTLLAVAARGAGDGVVKRPTPG